MIHSGVKEIPQYHVMKSWSKDARDYEYPKEASNEVEEQLGQRLLFANALDVVTKSGKAPKAGEILTRHLNLARKEIEDLEDDTSNDELTSAENTMCGYTSAEADYSTDQCAYTSDEQAVKHNVYGASGSSAYMSDVEIRQMKAPVVPLKSG